ncbi:phospholipase C [Streptomyces sp. NY05-11A]|uniref:phospholipase C n=1 Tax=Streptomyces soliscabiei TaxID=588897 RepID=UPI0029A336BB|nr:alkaline phosphatase family protein [Streptomyces sp. NY05-11A]MDX2683211.1 alkaline phosphatase family protein [Streptomyces sp. NY05-11A]
MRATYLVLAAVAGLVTPAAAVPAHPGEAASINHIVVLYQENRSFDHLYGEWGKVGGEHVRGLSYAKPDSTVQVGEDGGPLDCLYQNEPRLTSPSPLPDTCTDTRHPAKQGSPPTWQPVHSAFRNRPWLIDPYIPSDVPTKDLTHRFYQHLYQIDHGRQDRYVAGSSFAGLTMGHYDTTRLPIYTYLHGRNAPPYVVFDNFFQGAFGGSFLNHQWLAAAQTPVFVDADHSGKDTGCATGTANCDLHSAVDANGVPDDGMSKFSPPYYASPGGTVEDGSLAVAADASGRCRPSFSGAVQPPRGTLCGDYAVNSLDPLTQPYEPKHKDVGERLPLLYTDNVGDVMSARGISWTWYGGGWDNAVGNNGRDAYHPLGPGWTAGPTHTNSGTCTFAPGSAPLRTGAQFPYCQQDDFEVDHQPFAYFANYADNTSGRVQHLADEQKFLQDAARTDGLPAVSFVKPTETYDEHPGSSVKLGDQHLVDLVKAVEDGPNAKDTMVIVAYDEFGGWWDHVSPPGMGTRGPHDAFGPGNRVPALVIAPGLRRGVDHTEHDTTSVLATIEHRFGLRPLRLPDGRPARDARATDLFTAFPRHGRD